MGPLTVNELSMHMACQDFIDCEHALRHRLELSQGYIERKKAEYEALRAELESLRNEAPDAFIELPFHSGSKP